MQERVQTLKLKIAELFAVGHHVVRAPGRTIQKVGNIVGLADDTRHVVHTVVRNHDE